MFNRKDNKIVTSDDTLRGVAAGLSEADHRDDAGEQAAPSHTNEVAELRAALVQLRSEFDDLIDRVAVQVHPGSPRARRERAAADAQWKAIYADYQRRDAAAVHAAAADLRAAFDTLPEGPKPYPPFGKVTVGRLD